MNKFISSKEIDAEKEKLASLSQAEQEWERVRGGGFANIPSVPAVSQPSLYEMLKANESKEEEEDDNPRNSNLPKSIDEDEMRFFSEKRMQEAAEQRRLEIQLDQFKRASALASRTAKPEIEIIPLATKKTVVPAKPKVSLVKVVPVGSKQEDSDASSSPPPLKKAKLNDSADDNKIIDLKNDKPSSLIESNSTQTSQPNETTTVSKPVLVKYSRNDDE